MGFPRKVRSWNLFSATLMHLVDPSTSFGSSRGLFDLPPLLKPNENSTPFFFLFFQNGHKIFATAPSATLKRKSRVTILHALFRILRLELFLFE